MRSRLHLQLEPDQHRGLQAIAALSGVSIAELGRDLVSKFLREHGSLAEDQRQARAEEVRRGEQAKREMAREDRRERARLARRMRLDAEAGPKWGERKRLPDDRQGKTLHFEILTREGEEVVKVDGYLQTGEYGDGSIGEIFVKMGKSGSEASIYDAWATDFSIALQHGCLVETLCEKHINTRFEPSGPTNVPEVPRCTSPIDLICRWLMAKYGKPTGEEQP